MEEQKIVPFSEKYFSEIQELNKKEGWNQLVERYEETFNAWKNSNAAYVVIGPNEKIAGYIRCLTDMNVTIYVCEMLIAQEFRGKGLGGKLLKHVHNLYPRTRMEMLASSTSHSFYESQNFRPFYGFRKTYEE
ncbi:GNAT family N-acetyltransferase [Fictibacillus arsenicus]|uniref:GNAT family N-acetyltransferase n=1 Tax=Fictibacillus arsenicus TaxID=255247 RepID=A0A1V3G8N5_9BACL|nr:GNAT family N-acetyltransferase [Fictibacillus arsenicus]OOE12770.1 GNAT family N-acetyltransferase [Fictibacillus arsenicus]